MKNGFLEYYGEHHISPVNQNIKDIEIHYERRRKLYRQCGIPIMTFKNKEILEVGPGGGMNTLAFFHWGIKHADLIEPNPKGREDMHALFEEQGVQFEKYEVFHCGIEEYQSDKKYDVIIAEGFLQHVSNQQEIINKLKKLVADDGIIVITCTDHVCWFVERMKRMLSLSLVKDIEKYEDKVEYLSKLFEPQLAKLRGVSRTAKDYVQDNILNPVTLLNELSLAQAINFLNEGYHVLGSSPRMFTDYSWYKDIWVDCKKSFSQQFAEKRLTLLLANMPEKIVSDCVVENIVNHFECIRKSEEEYEKDFNAGHIKDIYKEMIKMKEIIEVLGDDFNVIFDEILNALETFQQTGTINIENYEHFFSSFGRMLQYIAFEKM